MAQQGDLPAITAEEQLEAARETIARLEQQLRRVPKSKAYERAVLRYNLGLAWQELPGGEKALNLSRAVASLQKSVALFDTSERPMEHARAQNALGAALRELGQRQEAVEAFTKAAEMAPAEINPGEHGAALNNLGLTLTDLGRTEEAERAFTDALAAFEGREFARQRLAVLHNLGQALCASGDADKVDEGIRRYLQALELADPQEHPYQWGLINSSLGVAYTSIERPQDAVESFRSALRVFTKGRFPFQHALTKNNLGLAHSQVGGVESLRRAVVAYEDALQVLDVRMHREQWEQAFRNLELAEQALEGEGERRTRPQHYVLLLASVDADERVGMLRDRLSDYTSLPEPRRTEALAQIDDAVLSLDDDAALAVTAAWLDVLMELPQPQFLAGLRARMAVQDGLDEAGRARAWEILDRALQSELLAPQRIRVRDTLKGLGYERPG